MLESILNEYLIKQNMHNIRRKVITQGVAY